LESAGPGPLPPTPKRLCTLNCGLLHEHKLFSSYSPHSGRSEATLSFSWEKSNTAALSRGLVSISASDIPRSYAAGNRLVLYETNKEDSQVLIQFYTSTIKTLFDNKVRLYKGCQSYGSSAKSKQEKTLSDITRIILSAPVITSLLSHN